MKKIFTLFALLSVSLSALADYYVPSATDEGTYIFYEDDGTGFTNLHMWGNNGDLTKWPGTTDGKVLVGQTSKGKNVYKWSINGTPTGIKFTKNGGEGDGNYSGDQQFVNHGYYYNGGYDHTVADGCTVYFYNYSWDEVYMYAYDSRENKYKVDWPGIKMEELGEDLELYSIHIDECSFDRIIFNNGQNGDDNQTQTLTASNEKVYVPDGTYNDYNNPNVFTADASLEVSDGVNFPFNKDFAVWDASYSRNVSNQWGTLCLPFGFKVSDQQLATQSVSFYHLPAEGGIDAEKRSIKFTQYGNNVVIDPGEAVLFKLLDSPEDRLHIRATGGVKVVSEPIDELNAYNRMIGTFERTVINEDEVVYYISGGNFYYGTNITVNPFRAYIVGELPEESDPESAPFRINIDDTEGIQFVEQEDGTVKAYVDLQGRKLDSARKGLVIENGKIIMVK